MAVMKETQEFIELLDVLGNSILEAKEDGKIDWRDAPKLVPVLLALRTGIMGAEKIHEEIRANPELTNLILDQVLNASLKLARAVVQ